jgi:hypothetical protein
MEKVIRKFKMGEEPNDLAYWLTKTPQERLSALEEMRDLTIRLMNNGTKPGFQRICTIVKSPQG